jgi:hypothetical protein
LCKLWDNTKTTLIYYDIQRPRPIVGCYSGSHSWN